MAHVHGLRCRECGREYDVAPIFPGVTQRMVNMAGERLTRLSTPRGFLIIRADHLEFRPVPKDSPHAEAGSTA